MRGPGQNLTEGLEVFGISSKNTQVPNLTLSMSLSLDGHWLLTLYFGNGQEETYPGSPEIM